MKTMIVGLVLSMTGIAQAAPRSGNVSFGGIQVKVTADPANGFFQIGESKFQSAAVTTPNGRTMRGNKRVGIMTWDETLTAVIYLDGGNGDDPQEYNCENARIRITRVNDRGQQTEVKNECAYLY